MCDNEMLTFVDRGCSTSNGKNRESAFPASLILGCRVAFHPKARCFLRAQHHSRQLLRTRSFTFFARHDEGQRAIDCIPIVRRIYARFRSQICTCVEANLHVPRSLVIIKCFLTKLKLSSLGDSKKSWFKKVLANFSQLGVFDVILDADSK